MFTLEWLKQQQERDPSRHWYVTGCTCKDCQEVRDTVTIPFVPEGSTKPSKKRKK